MNNARTNIYVFIICLLISLFLWSFIKISEETTITVESPIKYKGVPEDKIFSEEAPKKLSFKIKTKGFSLSLLGFKHKRKPIEFNLANLKYKEEKNIYYCKIIPLHYSNLLSGILLPSEQVISTDPDTIFISLERKISKKVPVRVPVKIITEKQYKLYKPIEIKPDCVVIKGKEKDIKNINIIQTKELILNNIKENREITINIEDQDKDKNNYLTYFPSQVKINIFVEQYTEKTLKIPLKKLNNPKGKILKLYPDEIEIRFLVAMKDYNSITIEKFSAYVEYKEEELGKSKTLKAKLDTIPFGISIRSIYPENIDYVLW